MTQIRRFSESLPMLLLRARETAMCRFRPVLHKHGLTEQQWRVMRALKEFGELTAAGVARECAMLAPSVTRILRKLAEEEIVSAERSPADQRELRVRLAPRGAELIDLIGPQSEQQYQLMQERLTPQRMALLYELLHEFVEMDGRRHDGPQASADDSDGPTGPAADKVRGAG